MTAAADTSGRRRATPYTREVLCDELRDELYWLSQCLGLERQLYGNREYVETMRATANLYFGVTQRMFHEAIFLSIHRMIDLPGSHDDQTASLQSLVSMMDAAADKAVRRQLQRSLTALRRDCADVTDSRHRILAHRDLRTVLMEKAPPNAVPIRVVRKTVSEIAKILQAFCEHYGLVIPIETDLGDDLDGDTLMFHLEAGLKQHPPMHFGPKSPQEK